MLLFTLERTILRNHICLFKCFLKNSKIIFTCYSLYLIYIFLFYLHTILVSSSNWTSKSTKKPITIYEMLSLSNNYFFLLDHRIGILLATLQRQWFISHHEIKVNVKITELTVKIINPKKKIIRIKNFFVRKNYIKIFKLIIRSTPFGNVVRWVVSTVYRQI